MSAHPHPHAQRSGEDIPLPMPPIGTPWPPRRGGATFTPASMAQDVVPLLDAGDRMQLTAAELAARDRRGGDHVEQARQEGFDAGMRCGAEYRSLWDVLVGVVWGVALLLLVLLGLGQVGWISVHAEASLVPEPHGQVAAAQALRASRT